MKLSQLLAELSIEPPRHLDADIRNISFHSKRVSPGDLFVAIAGSAADGHRYIDEAISLGAVAVIGEKAYESGAWRVPYVRVPNARLALARLAATLYGHPSRSHTMIGITGTNGKTTTAHLIRHLLERSGRTCSLFGTVECCLNGRCQPSAMTTYDAVQLQQWLRESQDAYAVMEVSSHGLTQHRVEGIEFDYAVFTNLTHEHLDYHRSMREYFEAKKRLFDMLKPEGEAIVNTNSTWGGELRDVLIAQGTPVYTVGRSSDDTLQLVHVDHSARPVATFRVNGDRRRMELPMPGMHNAWNAMSAVLFAVRKHIPIDAIADAIRSFPGVPGRFQTVPHPLGATALIDYAHTPDGLSQCLDAVRWHRPNRIIHVFGFRGRKDNSKWDAMVRISNDRSDETILTLDDLNGVEIRDMLRWYERFRGQCEVIEDRTIAIARAWESARPGDWIVITGKGPETYKEKFRLDTRTDLETIRLLASGHAEPVGKR